ncbi:serine hydrolase [Actinoallomurus sp. NBC_01490]|uniref:serine hydrolase domain-containing protein n=1 Tax=Actinoallomurus sp. NBC_01490 TaxID=2903557 RepID=UPI002E2F98DB|nr:serine hydrolase [Actinoallomurus sp. NBC_01490]
MSRPAAMLLAIMMVLGLPTPATAASRTDLRGVGALVDGIVPGQLVRERIPGAAVTVVAGGRTVFGKGYGLADVERHVPVSADRTEFFTGSMAKTITANAVLRLAADGKLDLNADVNTYLRRFRIPDAYPGRPVRVRDLLTHTAGFEDDVLGRSWDDPAKVPSLERIARRVPARVRPPGTLVAYDNYGYTLAGYLVEAVSGEPFDRYVERNVLAPLGMRGTTFALPHPPAVDAALAAGYRPDGDGFSAYRRYYGATPSGVGPVTTAADMGRYMIAQLQGDPRLGRGVARQMQARQYAQDPRLPGMGYGFEEWPRNGHRRVYKGGDVSGFHQVMALLPDDGVGIYVVYNGEGRSMGEATVLAERLVDRIVDRYFPARPGERPAPAGGDTSAYAGTYVPSRVRGDMLGFGTLFSPVTVTSTGDGTLHTSGLSPDPDRPEQDWVRIGPGLFAERGGQERIAFDGHGHLAGGHTEEASAYERRTGIASPVLHQIMLYAGLTAFLVAFAAIPVIALVRRLRGHRATHRSAWWLAWLTSALALAFAAGIAWLFIVDSDNAGDAIFLGSTVLTGALVASSTAFVLTAGLVAFAATAWLRRWWRPAGRVAYTLLTLGAAAFMTVAYVYHLVGGVFA